MGRYTLVREIGRGGMGIVFQAAAGDNEAPVAVKLLRPGPHIERHYSRLQREVRAAQKLNHPNAVTILDFGVDDDGRPYLVSELLIGETLRARLDRERALVPSDAIAIILPILSLLAEAHALGLVHRDLKPANIFLTDDGTVRVLDFGLVKLMTGTDSLGHITRTGMIGGTPRYVSPENAQGQTIDGRSDLYSLGVVFYEMLAGTAPFVADAPVTLLLRHIHDPVPQLVSPHGELDPALVGLIYRCLEKKPARRPSQAADLIPLLHDLASSTMTVRTLSPLPPNSDDTESTEAVEVTPARRKGAAKSELILGDDFIASARTMAIEPPRFDSDEQGPLIDGGADPDQTITVVQLASDEIVPASPSVAGRNSVTRRRAFWGLLGLLLIGPLLWWLLH